MLPIIWTALSFTGKWGLWFLKNPRVLAIAGIALFVGFIYLQLTLANNRVDRLEKENINLKFAVEVLEVAKETQLSNDIILTQRIVKQEEIVKSLSEAEAEIDAAPATDDGPVAPILKRTIEGIK